MASYAYEFYKDSQLTIEAETKLGLSIATNLNTYFTSFDEEKIGEHWGLGINFCQGQWKTKIAYAHYCVSFAESNRYKMSHDYRLSTFSAQLAYSFCTNIKLF